MKMFGMSGRELLFSLVAAEVLPIHFLPDFMLHSFVSGQADFSVIFVIIGRSWKTSRH